MINNFCVYSYNFNLLSYKNYLSDVILQKENVVSFNMKYDILYFAGANVNIIYYLLVDCLYWIFIVLITYAILYLQLAIIIFEHGINDDGFSVRKFYQKYIVFQNRILFLSKFVNSKSFLRLILFLKVEFQ